MHKEYLTDSVKIKLPSVDMFTYGYPQKVFIKFVRKLGEILEKQIDHFF